MIRYLQNAIILSLKLLGLSLIVIGGMGLLVWPLTLIQSTDAPENELGMGFVVTAAASLLIGLALWRIKWIERPQPPELAPEARREFAGFAEPDPQPVFAATTNITINIPGPNGQQTAHQVQLARCGHCGGMSPQQAGYCQNCRAPLQGT